MEKVTRSPFKFLDAYGKEDQSIFFGREEETLEMYDRLFETNLLLLYGASGTGKTSLINCGLSNQFEPSDWMPIFIRRKDNILEALKDALLRARYDQSNQKTDQQSDIYDLINCIYKDYFKPIYLIFDQFEEIFILGDRQEREAFFRHLDDLLMRDLQCKIIISMREEYIASLSEYEMLVPNLWDNRLRVEPMNNKNLKQVILGTTKQFNITVSSPNKLPDNIIKKIRDKKGIIDLATLQVYLDRLYLMDAQRRGEEQRPITFNQSLLDETGNLEDVMSSFLDEQIEVIEKELKETKNIEQTGIPLDVLFALVTDNGTKQSVEVKEVKQHLKRLKNIEADTVDYCIKRFKEMRILRELSD